MMNVTPDSVFGFGVVIVAVALVVLLLVHFELRAVGGLARVRHWFLLAALGSGVAAFAVKLLLIVVLSNGLGQSQDGTKSPTAARGNDPGLAKQTLRRRWVELAAGDSIVTGGGGYRWQTLPETMLVQGDESNACARVTLGKRLFFDPRLSRDGTLSCASCHDVAGGAGHDGRPTAVGIDSQVGPRNTPTVWNAAFQARLFWDGRASSLEEQAKGPLVNPAEMGMPSLQAVVERVVSDREYHEAFARAFGRGQAITIDRIAQAIADFERTLVTADSAYDRFVRGELGALSATQLRGMALFESVGCINCHYGPNFSAASRFDSRAPLRIFPAMATPFEERYHLTDDRGAGSGEGGRGVWRVPSLRNVALTAPYFHNGAVAELKQAVRIMANVQLGRTGRMLVWSEGENRLELRDGDALTEQELDDIVAFLGALSSDRLLAWKKRRDISRTTSLGYPPQGDDLAEGSGCRQ